MSEIDQPAPYTVDELERKPGYIIYQITLARGGRHFCIKPLVRFDAQNMATIRGQMSLAHSLAQARAIGQKFKQAAIEEGYAVE
jgi:hypothetical protein